MDFRPIRVYHGKNAVENDFITAMKYVGITFMKYIPMSQKMKEGRQPIPDYLKVKHKNKGKKYLRGFSSNGIVPDVKKEIVRPPAEYSNGTPYNLAKDFLQHPKEDPDQS